MFTLHKPIRIKLFFHHIKEKEMNKIVLSFILAASLLYSKESIELNFAPKSLERETPASQTKILSYNTVLEKAQKSLVNISTQKSVENQIYANPFMNDPFFREFFRGYDNGRVPQERIERSLGSGVIISQDGYIVTNNHVVEGADKIKVSITGDQKEYDAKVIGRDAKSDIAIIKIDIKSADAISFYDSDDVKVGDVVFALGNPFGVGQTITQGIVSATGRSSVGIVEYENFIQTDASINPGNSGGALINSAGYLIGINSAIISKSGGNVGIGFAIPSNMVSSIAKELIENGKFTRAYLGVAITNVSDDMSGFYNNRFGALITSIEDDTPAAKAGLKRGDLITAIDGKKIDSASKLKNIIGTYPPDATIKVTLLRDKKEITKEVKLGSQENSKSSLSGDYAYKGLSVAPLDKNAKNQYGIGANVKGVIVTEIEKDSPASSTGIMQGDIIIQIENAEISDLEDFKRATANQNKKRIYIYRRGAILAVVL